MRENRSPGSVPGALGNRRSYGDGGQLWKKPMSVDDDSKVIGYFARIPPVEVLWKRGQSYFSLRLFLRRIPCDVRRMAKPGSQEARKPGSQEARAMPRTGRVGCRITRITWYKGGTTNRSCLQRRPIIVTTCGKGDGFIF